jgi:sugar phosphate isomerase/epimerase
MALQSRRRFIAVAGGATAAAASAVLLSHKASAGPMGLPSGIQLYTVSQPLSSDAAGTLKALRGIGYTEVESAGLGMISAKEFRGLLDDAGLKCPSAHLDLSGPGMDAQFADAKTLGAHYVVSSVLITLSDDYIKAAKEAIAKGTPPPKPPKLGPFGPDDFKKMAAQANDTGKAAKAAGLQYAYHNHNFEFVKMPDGSPAYDLLIKETDPELVKFEIDCGWMVVAGGNPVEYFRKYPGRFRMLHIKDFKPVAAPTTDLMGDGRPTGTDLGKGFIDYKPIFAAGKAAGIEHIFAEQEAPFSVSQMESAKLDYAFLQQFK